MKWNDESLLYQDFVRIAEENNFAVPKDWLCMYHCFIDAMSKHKEQTLVKIRELLKPHDADHYAEGKETSEENTNKER